MAEAFQDQLKFVNNRITNQPTGRHFTLPGKLCRISHFMLSYSQMLARVVQKPSDLPDIICEHSVGSLETLGFNGEQFCYSKSFQSEAIQDLIYEMGFSRSFILPYIPS